MKNIFISSTFRDMQAERDLVQERVLPALREEARKYGENVGVIDLRWGVDTSKLDTDEGFTKVLTVCLDEIDRSHPYMLIFLGERYGWIPNGKLIEKALRGRTDKYIADDFEKSITALEIEYGALSEKYGDLSRCVVCFREPMAHLLEGEERTIYEEQDAKGVEKLRALKERIRKKLDSEDRLITYSCTWDKSIHAPVDFMVDGQPLEVVVTQRFVEMLKQDWEDYESLSWQDKEQLAFRAFMESKMRSFLGREALLEEYYNELLNATCPIILQGKVGSGKTAIMCKLIERLRKEGKAVFSFFSGAGNMSTSAELLVKQMVYYLENLPGVAPTGTESMEGVPQNETEEMQYADWLDRFQDLCSRIPENERVYFCIDEPEQLYQDKHVEKLDFLFAGEKVQMLVSCTETFVLPMDTMGQRIVKVVPTLSVEDAKTVAKGILAAYSRNAYEAIEQEILKKKGIENPLYISRLIQRLNMMDADELYSARTEEEIIALGTEVVRSMPEEPEAALVSIIENGINKVSDNKDALQEIMYYLAVSGSGLRMQDLQAIFAAKGITFPSLDFTLLLKYLDAFFYIREDGRIDFANKLLRRGLLNVIEDRRVYESRIRNYLKTLDENDLLRIQEGIYYARIDRDYEFAKQLIVQAYQTPNELLVRSIKKEAVEDEGAFCCELIERETEEESFLRRFMQDRLLRLLGWSQKEMKTRINIAEAFVRCEEVWDLAIDYDNIVRPEEALVYCEKDLKRAELLYERCRNDATLWDLAFSYNSMGNALEDFGRREDAQVYFRKALKCKEASSENA